MKLTIESTNKLTRLDGRLTRVWKGSTETGVECFVFVAAVGVGRDVESTEFDAELVRTVAPAEDCIVPLRSIV